MYTPYKLVDGHWQINQSAIFWHYFFWTIAIIGIAIAILLGMVSGFFVWAVPGGVFD